jgi:hypothetical protein
MCLQHLIIVGEIGGKVGGVVPTVGGVVPIVGDMVDHQCRKYRRWP